MMSSVITMPASAEAPFSNRKFVYRADGKRVTEVLQDFAAAQSVPIVIDAGVDGTVNAEFNSRPVDFLSAISKSYGLIWYFDGVTLFVYPSRAMSSKVFRMRGYDRTQVAEMLKSLGLGDARFPLRFNEADQTLLAYGPPRHIELVQTVVDTLESSSRDKIGKTIQIVPLKYAVASDRISGQARVPGLVTTLNNMFAGDTHAAGGATEAAEDAVRRALGPVVGTAQKQRSAELNFGIKPPDSSTGGAKDTLRDSTGRQISPESPGNGEDDRTRPFFQAYEASNAIIVRGLPERMKQYEALIQQLDVPQDMVEIEASIIDVSTDEFNSLGIEWDFTRAGRSQISISPGSPVDSSGNSSNSLAGTNNITTLVADAGRQLITRIRALEGTGKARIVARPKVLGAANRMASMIDKRVASVRVAGNLDVNLFTVEAGTTLQVMPQILTQGDQHDLRLTLFIEDGSFEGNVVDSVPIIKRTEIRTEATIHEGESLLIGGISVETDSKGRSGLPGLSRIPLFGALFRHDEVSSQRSERMFLITPKLVNSSVAKASLPAATAPALPASAAAIPAPSASAASAAPAAPPASAPLPPPSSQAPPAAPADDCPARALGLPDTQCPAPSPTR